MGGGKTKTYRDFDTGEVFDPETNLFSKDIIKFAGISSQSGFSLGRSLVESISAFTNIKYLEKLDAAGTAEGTKQEINDKALSSHFNVVEPAAILYATTRSSDGRELPGYLIANIENLPSNGALQKTITYNANTSANGQFGINTFYEGTHGISLSVNVYNININTNAISVNSETGQATYTPTIRQGELALTMYNGWEAPLFIENADGTIQYQYTYQEDYIYTYEAEVCTTAGDPPVTTCTTVTRYAVGQRVATQYINMPRIEKQIIVAVIGDNYSLEHTGGENDNIIINTGNITIHTAYDTDIVRDTTGFKYLLMHFKRDGEFIEDRKMLALYNNFGIKRDDLYETDEDGNEGLGSPDLKHAAFTYAGQMTIDQKYGEVALDHKASYGFLGYGKGELTINSPTLSFKYLNNLWISGSDEGLELKSSLKINGNTFNAPFDGYIYLIPIGNMKTLPMNIRYQFVVEHFRLAFLSVVVVKLKWYQTGLFKFMLMAVSMFIPALHAYQGAVQAATAAGASTAAATSAGFTAAATAAVKAFAIMMVVKIAFKISPELGAAVSIAAIAYGVYDSGGWSEMSTLQQSVTVVTIAGSMSKYYFTIQNDKITNEILDIQEKDKELKEAIADMRKAAIYDPLDATQSYYDLVYELHNVYSEAQFDYDVFYDFDTITATQGITA